MTFGEVERVDIAATVKKPCVNELEDINYMISRTTEEDTLLLSDYMQNYEINESEKDDAKVLDEFTPE